MVILLFKQWALSKQTAFFMEYSEIYIANIFLCLFVLKDSRVSIFCTVISIIILDVFCYLNKKDDEFVDNIATSINCWIGSCFIMNSWQKEYDENLKGKITLQNRELALRDVLELFPSGIVFYNRQKGAFYQNKFWNDMLDSIKSRCNFDFWSNRTLNSCLSDEDSEPEFIETKTRNLDRKNQKLFSSLYHKENKNQSLDDLLDRFYFKLYRENSDEDSQESEVENLISKHNNSFNEYEVKDANKRTIKEFSIKFAPISVASEEKAIMIVFNDISERTRLKETRISDYMKTIMLCSISHELRSPVNQINGVLSLIQPTLKTVEQQRLLKIANCSTEMLRIKINDMLDYYEIETKGFKPDIVKFYPREQLKFLESLFVSLIDKKNVKLYFFVHQQTPKYVYHDSKRIMQILVNLLSNAIKYTKKGAILVIIDWQQTGVFKGKPEGTIKFTVSDSGWGIPKERRRDIFKFLDFSKFKDYIKDGEELNISETKLAGTGLGISQKVAKELKSKIEFTSIVGIGSKFYLKLETSTVRESPIFAPFGRFHQRRKILNQNEGKPVRDLNLTAARMVINKIKFKRGAYRKRSLSIDEGNSAYEKVNLKAKINAYKLVDIDQVCKSGTLEGTEPKDELLENIEKENLFLNKYSRISCLLNSSGSQSNDFMIPDEGTTSGKVPAFIETASHGVENLHYLVTESHSSYFSNNDEEFDSIRSNKVKTSEYEFFSNKPSLFKRRALTVTKREPKEEKAQPYIHDTSSGKSSDLDGQNEVINITVSSIPQSPNIDPKFKKDWGCASILIVDDQYINRFIIQQFCDKYGIKAEQAEDGQEAIDIIRNESTKVCWEGISLVLMDLNMPVLGGIEAAYRLSKLKKNHEIPQSIKIVAVTAFPSQSEKEKCYTVGMSQFFVKPFTIANFIKLISV